MLIAIDIGNTEIVIGLYKENEILFTSRLETNRKITTDQYAMELNDILRLHNHSLKDIKSAVISSVVKNVGSKVIEAIKKYCEIMPIIVGIDTKVNFNLKIDEGQIVGADLITGAVAVVEKYKLPAIVFDFGTATTVSVIDREANFIGGIISPGIGISCEALSGITGLPKIEFNKPNSIIGKNTIDSMLSGAIYGAASFIDGMTERIQKEIGEECTIIVTGGLGEKIIDYTKNEVILNKDLLLEGLLIINKMNS